MVNRAKLAYNSVAAWLDGKAPPPPPVAAVPGMDAQLRMQDKVAQLLKGVRKSAGALGLTTLEAQAVYEGARSRTCDRMRTTAPRSSSSTS